jgi:hypothetical protein
MKPLALLLATALAATGQNPPSAPPDEAARLRAQRDASRDVVERAKIAVQMGELLLRNLTARYRASDRNAGEKLLDDYRRTVRDAQQELLRSGRDARRHPGGFKQLEIHLRVARRKLEDLARALAVDDRPPIEDAMEEVETLRSELLDALMKSRPKKRKPSPESKQP